MTLPVDTLRRLVNEQPHPLLLATVSGAHLYGFPSPDSARLRVRLQDAFDRSTLPELPTGKPQLNDLLLRLRKV